MEYFRETGSFPSNLSASEWLLSNTTTTILPEITPMARDLLISEEAFYYFNNYFLQMSLSIASTVGIVTNAIIVIVYCKHVPRDGVATTFIFLSVSELTNCAFSLLSIGCYVLQGHWPIKGVNLFAVQYVYLGYTRGCAYTISTCLTVYLSIERCICILFPLSVKVIFSSSRSLIIKISIVIFGLACFAPAWATQGLHEVFNPATNESYLDIWVSANRREIDLFVDTFNGVVLPTIAQVILTISAVIIVNGLKASVKFRQLNSGKRENTSVMTTIPSKDLPGKATTVMTSKDAKAAKVVVLVAVIFFVCNVPVLVVAYARMFVEELDFGRMYYRLYTVLYTIVYASGLINASVNIVVYYSVSAKFKSIFLSLFCISK